MLIEEEDAYKSKASGMGQTRGMSVFSADGEQEFDPAQRNDKSLDNSKLIKPASASNDSVDFFNDRDFYKIFLETSKEQEKRIKMNSPFAGLKTWKLLRVIVKTNDDLR